MDKINRQIKIMLLKKTFSYIILVVITCLTISCKCFSQIKKKDKSSNFSEIQKANWLIGAWQNNSPKMNIMETWKKENDSTYVGQGYTMVGKDMVSEESLAIKQRRSQLSYTSKVKNQNDGKVIVFLLTSSTNKQLVFENPEHDFPQIISYSSITEDSLVAEISGMSNGKLRVEKFPMTRVK